MNPVVIIEVFVLMAATGFNGLAILRLHKPLHLSKKMDYFDHAARDGVGFFFGAVAIVCVLLVAGAGVEWRLPLITLTAVYCATGLQRDLRRELKKDRRR